MSGIVGFINQAKGKKTIIKSMSQKIKHRGPDANIFYVDKNSAFGEQRLLVSSLFSNDNLIFNKEKNLVIVFDGEIYNFSKLKVKLSKNTDLEIKNVFDLLVSGYEKWGSNLAKYLRGMFAFAIYDVNKKRLLLARDSFGIKPLYYAYMNKTFMFASEIKALLNHPDFKKDLNQILIAPYLGFGFTPTLETLFKGVYTLDAASYLIYQNNRITIKKYFVKKFNEKEQDFKVILNNIEKVMQDSVQNHLIATNNFGSFLSSGIDSSYLVALSRPKNTYTVGYDNLTYSEINYAKDLTTKLGLKNKSKKISQEEYLDIIPKIMYYLDEPSSDAASVALYFAAKLASKDVKIVLSGEGADEFFGGYNSYRKDVDLAWYNKIPYLLRHFIALICKMFPEKRGLNFLVRRGEKLEDNYIGVSKVFSAKEIKKVLCQKKIIKPIDIVKKTYLEYQDQNDLIKMQAIDINYWLKRDILLKADKMLATSSIEGRLPFIDNEVFKVACQIPSKYKVTKENTKIALREVAKKVIPTEAYKKKKLGFPVPLREWLKTDLYYEEIKKTFTSSYAQKFFNQDYLLKMLNEHKNNKKDNFHKIWTIYCFLIWYRVYFIDKR